MTARPRPVMPGVQAMPRYVGRVAESYEARRIGTMKWEREHAAVEALLRRVQPGSVLDVPVGTGRFLPLYDALGISAIGVDISAEMLAQARAKSATADLRIGDALALDLPAQSVDLGVCVRFLSWLTPAEQSRMLCELARVARRGSIVTVRLTPAEAPIFAAALDAAPLRVTDTAMIDPSAERGDYRAFLLVPRQ